MSKEILHMKIDAGLKRELKELAEADNRNMSNLVEKILKDYVKEQKGRS